MSDRLMRRDYYKYSSWHIVGELQYQSLERRARRKELKAVL